MAESRDIKRLIHEVDELFNNIAQMPRLVAHRRAFRPPVDVFRTDEPPTITVVAELAGVQPDDVELEVVEGGVVITGTRSHHAPTRRTYQCMEIIQGDVRTSCRYRRSRRFRGGDGKLRRRTSHDCAAYRESLERSRAGAYIDYTPVSEPEQDIETPEGLTEGLPDSLPILPLRESVVFPESIAPLAIGQERSVRLVDDAVEGNRMIALVAKRETEGEGAIGRRHL